MQSETRCFGRAQPAGDGLFFFLGKMPVTAEPPLTLGEKVVIMGKRKGTVRYIGDTAYGPGEWVGVELEKPTGTHDGGVNGQVHMQ
jgi:hypothetical protein